MCKIDWALVSGFIAAIASLANAALLIWMILVTKRYVQATLALLDVNRRSLQNAQEQYLALIDREIRPFKNLLERTIRTLEELKMRDLVYEFENRDEVGWLREEELLPFDFTNVAVQAMSFDADLYTSLDRINTKLILRPKAVISEMHRLGRSGRSTFPELPELQRQFRASLDPILDLLKSTRDELLARTQSEKLSSSVEH